MSIKVNAMAFMKEGDKEAVPYTYELSEELPEGQVDLEVQYCGLCRSDYSLAHNEWKMTKYPFVGGHEVVAKVIRSNDKNIKVGQMVGVGASQGDYCHACTSCEVGDVHLCPSGKSIMKGNHGGFGTHCRVWGDGCIPLPENVDPVTVGPLLCGGLTVWTPVREYVTPVSRVGVIGIGGLGHMCLQFLKNTGCHVIAFTTKPVEKAAELKAFGATEIIDSKDAAAIRAAKCDLIISTVDVELDWAAYIDALNPRGRLHFVGVVLAPIPVSVFSILTGQKSVSASPIGSIIEARHMLAFSARNAVKPQVEVFPLEKLNDAMKKVEDGSIRYRAVLKVKQ